MVPTSMIDPRAQALGLCLMMPIKENFLMVLPLWPHSPWPLSPKAPNGGVGRLSIRNRVSSVTVPSHCLYTYKHIHIRTHTHKHILGYRAIHHIFYIWLLSSIFCNSQELQVYFFSWSLLAFLLLLLLFFFLFFFFFFFFFFGHACTMGKFPGQGSNLRHSSDNVRSSTCWATRELW